MRCDIQKMHHLQPSNPGNSTNICQVTIEFKAFKHTILYFDTIFLHYLVCILNFIQIDQFQSVSVSQMTKYPEWGHLAQSARYHLVALRQP